jgi:hypothetical protein
VSIGHRYGMAVGLALVPVMFGLLFGYHARDLPLLPGAGVWPWMAAPVVVWFGAETAARLWRRMRWFGFLLSMAAGVGAGVSWWWQHGLYVWGGGSTLVSDATPTVIVGVYLLVAIVSGRLRTRPTNTVRVEEFDHITR